MLKTFESTQGQQPRGHKAMPIVKTPVLLVGNFHSRVNGDHPMCEDLWRELQKRGWDVIATSTKVRRGSKLIDMVRTVYRRKNDYSVAVVDVYSGWAFTWAEAVALALRSLRKPYVLVLRGGNLPTFAKRWPRRAKALLSSANAVLTPSTFLQSQMSPYCANLQLQPNPLKLSSYPFHERKEANPSLLWLRAFHKMYNPSLAPRVVALLQSAYPEVRLIMVGRDKGDGSLQETLKMATALGVSDRITITGPVSKSEVPQWLNQGDIFLNTTNIDNTPVSVLEAMACGLCVVSTNVGGLPYLVEDGNEALLVDPNSAEAMANAVRRVLSDSQLASRLSSEGRRKVVSFDWSVIGSEWERILSCLGEVAVNKDDASNKRGATPARLSSVDVQN
jgi:glycosyltransferase involved in cell wall biosynthesis